MVKVMKDAISHKGFAFIDVYQPCVSWNKLNTYAWWKQRIYDLEKEGHDPTNFEKAMEKALEPYRTNWEKVPIGIFYKEERQTLEDVLVKGIPVNESLEVDVSSDLRELM